MVFFIFLDINSQFAKKKLIRKSYTIAKVLQFRKNVEFNKNRFTEVILSLNAKLFLMHIIALKLQLKAVDFLIKITI